MKRREAVPAPTEANCGRASQSANQKACEACRLFGPGLWLQCISSSTCYNRIFTTTVSRAASRTLAPFNPIDKWSSVVAPVASSDDAPTTHRSRGFPSASRLQRNLDRRIDRTLHSRLNIRPCIELGPHRIRKARNGSTRRRPRSAERSELQGPFRLCGAIVLKNRVLTRHSHKHPQPAPCKRLDHAQETYAAMAGLEGECKGFMPITLLDVVD